MASASRGDIQNMALFCDFENMVLGARNTNSPEFDIRKVLERLLVKGDIVVKKAYCDWQNYKDFKKSMHEAAFELIEVPHVSQSGKNSADIRMVVDALDLCYTKGHVDAFVIISGDSDFSPLVSKLRENNKTVIGVGVRAATSDLLKNNCDEFIFYDDLVKADEARKKAHAKKQADAATPGIAGKKVAEPSQKSKQPPAKKATTVAGQTLPTADSHNDAKRAEAIDLVVETVEALMSEKDLDDFHASQVKQALKRRRPDFLETAFGFKGGFNKILEEAAKRGLLKTHKDGNNLMVSLPHS
ncbi:MAG: NYN domain-containing protein [Pseudomonadota bacterium]